MFSAETTGPIFTKILHDIVALVTLFNHAYTWRYPIPFLNARATKVPSLPFFSQNRLPWQLPLRYRKNSRDRSSALKTLSFGENIANIGLVDPEIFDKICQTQREHATQFPSVILFFAETIGLNFTKILQDIVAVAALSNHAYTWC